MKDVLLRQQVQNTEL